ALHEDELEDEPVGHARPDARHVDRPERALKVIVLIAPHGDRESNQPRNNPDWPHGDFNSQPRAGLRDGPRALGFNPQHPPRAAAAARPRAGGAGRATAPRSTGPRP